MSRAPAWHFISVIAFAFACAVASTAGHSQQPASAGFPHLKHRGLFPTCASCHAGIATGEQRSSYPPAESCVDCHDGTTSKLVTWAPPRPAAGQPLLVFDHGRHFAQTDTAGRQCATCHAAERDTAFMAVAAARGESCTSCHAHRAASHLAPDSRCATCHRPLASATRLTRSQVESLPQPESHRDARFLVAHGPANTAAVAQCATCHARESCLRCHVDARSLGPASTLLGDARVAAVVARKLPRYPTPDDHLVAAFINGHGSSAQADVARCSTCHARASCSTCHTGLGAAPIVRQLPAAAEGAAAGVRLVLERRATADARQRASDSRGVTQTTGAATDTSARTVRAHPRDFSREHRGVAAAAELTCQGCHSQRFCSDCHAGETRRAFHPANFVVRHAAEGYGGERDCSSCHNREVFCRDCHRATGIGSRQSNRAQTFHTAQPQWLLQHGRAARQSLTTCTTCHAQSSCMRCHSTTGWGVNPHGNGFNADRLGARALTMCAACHIADPRRR